jgi:sugar phosphate isomerase/epimerase
MRNRQKGQASIVGDCFIPFKFALDIRAVSWDIIRMQTNTTTLFRRLMVSLAVVIFAGVSGAQTLPSSVNLGGVATPTALTEKTSVDHTGLSAMGWQLACPNAFFPQLTSVEMIELAHEWDLHHFEFSPGQIVSSDFKDQKFGPDMSAASFDALSAKLKAVKMDIVSYGVVPMTGKPDEDGKIFAFAAKLKVKNLVVDAPEDSLESLDKLANQYKVNVAVVNQAKPGHFWNADTLNSALASRDKLIGVCPDLAAFKSSGEVPLDAVTTLSAHVLEYHLTDVDAAGKPVAFGMGTVGGPSVLKFAKSKNFKGIFAVEYLGGTGVSEYGNFIKSVNNFSAEVTKLHAGN